jgi:hypothetical protein
MEMREAIVVDRGAGQVLEPRVAGVVHTQHVLDARPELVGVARVGQVCGARVMIEVHGTLEEVPDAIYPDLVSHGGLPAE